LPAGESRLELIADRWAHVEEAGARSTAQPFENATGQKIGLASFHVNRHDADGVKGIEGNEGSCFVGASADRVDILQKRAPEEHVRNSDEAGPFVDCLQQLVAV